MLTVSYFIPIRRPSALCDRDVCDVPQFSIVRKIVYFENLEILNFPDCQIPLFVWQKARSQSRGSLTGDPEEAAPRVEQVRPGAFVRQLCIALDQGLQNSFVIVRRAFMQL